MPSPRRVFKDKDGPGPATAEALMTLPDEFDRTWNQGWNRQAERKNSPRRPSSQPCDKNETPAKGRKNGGNTEGQRVPQLSTGEDVKHNAVDSEDLSQSIVAERLMTPEGQFDRAWDKSWHRERLKELDGGSKRAEGHQETSTWELSGEQRHGPRNPRDEALEVCIFTFFFLYLMFFL